MGYLPTYLTLAGAIGTQGRVCELGVQAGYSLELWQALFPDGLVVGVDSNAASTWPAGTCRVVAKQEDPALPGLLVQLSPTGYDLIVDDASHDGPTTRAAFEALWPLVVGGGTYVIEDWQTGFDGIGFDLWDGSMVDLACDLLDALKRPGGEVCQITYRHGLILLRRRV